MTTAQTAGMATVQVVDTPAQACAFVSVSGAVVHVTRTYRGPNRASKAKDAALAWCLKRGFHF